MKEEKMKVSPKKLREIVFQVASDLDWSIKNENEELISLTYEGDLFSFGNKIEIEIIPNGRRSSQLKVKSKSQFAIQLLDWGKNRELEEEFMEEIKDRI